MIYNVLHGFSNLPQGIIHESRDTSHSLNGMVFFSTDKVGTEAKHGG